MSLNFHDFEGFAFSSRDTGSREQMAIATTATLYKFPFKIFQNVKHIPVNWIPVGSVEWCCSYLGRNTKPNYYPEFLLPYLHRKIWQTNEWPLGKKVFIKPSDKDKRFTGFVTNGGYKKKKKGPYWCSEVVSFVNEWRYYVANGKVLTAEWYQGDEINTPDAPKIDINWPNGYCNAVDFGLDKENKLVLVEANQPFACGWYGKNHELYTKWIVEGWKFVINNL